MRIFLFIITALFLQPIWANVNHYHGHPSNSLANALMTGTDTNGNSLYLCVAKIFNSTQPGKTWEGYGRCNVPYGGKEYIVDRFEIPPRTLFNGAYWQDNPRLPLAVGRDTNGTPLFLCQAYFNGSKQPGKTWPGYNNCNISYAGREIITDNYQIFAADSRQGARTHSHPDKMKEQCLSDSFGNQACGYNCLRSINQVACARSPDQHCVANNFGHISCGYGCVKSPLKVACANQPWQNCVINKFNEVRCGKNCRVNNFNQIQCEN